MTRINAREKEESKESPTAQNMLFDLNFACQNNQKNITWEGHRGQYFFSFWKRTPLRKELDKVQAGS